MLMVTLRDLQWRRRRFAIGVAATALVFAMTLLLDGVGASFSNEVNRTLKALGADAWLVPRGESGPFSASATLRADLSDRVGAVSGVERAEPLVILEHTFAGKELNLIGQRPGGIVAPEIVDGRELRSEEEAVADTGLGVDVGDSLELGDRRLSVVGLVTGIRFKAGSPTLFVPIGRAQDLAFAGQPLATALITQGTPRSVPPNLVAMSPDQVRDDLLRPLSGATGSIDFMSALLWIVAAGIIGSIVYLSALERVRDFAVLKATGASNRHLLAGLALQAVILAVSAALLAMVIARILVPAFPISVEVPLSAFLVLPVIAVVVGLLASAAGLRRAVGVDPALAFGGVGAGGG
jgi:putative ABC transport system permease protein